MIRSLKGNKGAAVKNLYNSKLRFKQPIIAEKNFKELVIRRNNSDGQYVIVSALWCWGIRSIPKSVKLSCRNEPTNKFTAALKQKKVTFKILLHSNTRFEVLPDRSALRF